MDLRDFANTRNGQDLLVNIDQIAKALNRIATVLESLDKKTRPHVPPAPVEPTPAPEVEGERPLANGDEGW